VALVGGELSGVDKYSCRPLLLVMVLLLLFFLLLMKMMTTQ